MSTDTEATKKLYEPGDKLLVHVGFTINASSSLIFSIHNAATKTSYSHANDYPPGEETQPFVPRKLAYQPSKLRKLRQYDPPFTTTTAPNSTNRTGSWQST